MLPQCCPKQIHQKSHKKKPLITYWLSRVKMVAGARFELTTFRLWAWRATGLLHPAIRLSSFYARLFFLSRIFLKKHGNYNCKYKNNQNQPLPSFHFYLLSEYVVPYFYIISFAHKKRGLGNSLLLWLFKSLSNY